MILNDSNKTVSYCKKPLLKVGAKVFYCKLKRGVQHANGYPALVNETSGHIS
ncbi:hypothetical protein J32TS6_29800 [Virgibacillus pantothenticus]|nr:hypothetical protein J32TS6_29800 [Virgibacillus pantothenticus]